MSSMSERSLTSSTVQISQSNPTEKGTLNKHLRRAILAGQLQLVKSLHQAGADVNSYDGPVRETTQFESAVLCYTAYSSTRERQRENDPVPAKDGFREDLAITDRAEIIDYLLEAGADLNNEKQYIKELADSALASLAKQRSTRADFTILLPEWATLKDYLASEFESPFILDDVVVLVSDDGEDTWCGTCRAYVDWRWGPTGCDVLSFLNTALNITPSKKHGSSDATIFQIFTENLDLALTSLDSGKGSLLGRGTLSTSKTVTDMLAWIFDSLRAADEQSQNTEEDHSARAVLCTPAVYRVHKRYMETELLSKSFCWRPLFPNKAVSHGCIPLRSTKMHGLEIDYSLLISISGVDLPSVEDGGIYLDGLCSALYPIKKDVSSDSLQWHLQALNMTEDDENDRNSSKNPPHDWLRTRNLDDLTKPKRHFVGWCTSAVVTFGTSLQHAKVLDWSDAKIEKKEVVETTTNLNLNLTFQGVGVSGGKSFKRGKTERNAFEGYEENLRSALLRASKDQILTTRITAQQVWLVPKTSFLLQLVQSYLKYLMAEDSALCLSVPFAEESHDGGWSAYQALWDHRNDEVPLEISTTPCLLRNIVRMFLHALEKLEKPSEPGKLYGWEMKDLIDPPKFFDMKSLSFRRRQLPGYGGWTRLLPSIRSAFFFEGLGDPIIASERNQCRNCKSIPKNRNLLGVTMISLEHLTRRHHSRYLNGDGQLTENSYWNSPIPPFGSDRDGYRHHCNIVQQIYWHGRCDPPGSREIKRGEKGAVVFEPCGLSGEN